MLEQTYKTVLSRLELARLNLKAVPANNVAAEYLRLLVIAENVGILGEGQFWDGLATVRDYLEK